MLKHFVALTLCGFLGGSAYAAQNPVDFTVLAPFKSPMVVGANSQMTAEIKSNLPFNITGATINVPSTLTVVPSGTTCNIHNQTFTQAKPSCLLEVNYHASAVGAFSFTFVMNYASSTVPLPPVTIQVASPTEESDV
jgi:hypothetical protein